MTVRSRTELWEPVLVAVRLRKGRAPIVLSVGGYVIPPESQYQVSSVWRE